MKKRVGFFLCACIVVVGTAGSSSNTITVRSSGVDGDTVSGGEAKIAITVTAGSTSLLYDGKQHDYHQYIMNNQLAIGDTILVTVEGQAKNIGDTVNQISSVVVTHDEGGTQSDVTSNYSITLVAGNIRITPAYLIFAANGNSRTYDGTPLLPEVIDGKVYKIEGGALAKEQQITSLTVSGSQTEVGESASKIDKESISITDQEGIDTTSNYLIAVQEGRLIVTQALETLVPKEQITDTPKPIENAPEEHAPEIPKPEIPKPEVPKPEEKDIEESLSEEQSLPGTTSKAAPTTPDTQEQLIPPAITAPKQPQATGLEKEENKSHFIPISTTPKEQEPTKEKPKEISEQTSKQISQECFSHWIIALVVLLFIGYETLRAFERKHKIGKQKDRCAELKKGK